MRRLIVLLFTTIVVLSLGSAAVTAQQVHIVQRGENLFSIARQYGRTLAEVAQANGIAPPYTIHMGNFITIPLPGGSTQAPAPGPAQQPSTGTSAYAVQRGESLAIIALKFNTTYIILAELNGIIDPDILHVGQVLQVPNPPEIPPPGGNGSGVRPPQPATATYTVQPGDSLAIIAAKFNSNYFELAQLNGITDPDVLDVGQVLRVPGEPPPPPPPPAPAPTAPDPGTAPPVAPGPPSTANVSGFELGGQALTFAHPEFMRNARMTWVKRQVKWHGEPASNFQHLIDSAHGNGFKVLLSVIGEKNQIASNPGGFYQNFANFLAELARGGADAIEVWNEMNIDREWPSGQISGNNYTQMLSAAYQAIKGANPGTMVISGAPAPTGYFQGCGAGGGDDDCFLREMAAAGAANVMDCVGVHYNAGITPPDSTSGAPVGSAAHYSWYLPRMMQLYRSFFPGKPLCFTELGYLTREGYGPLPGNFAWASGTTLAQQATWLAGAVHRLRGSGYVRLFIVWNVDATHWGSDPQAGYAIVRPGNSCPACDSLRGAMGG